MKGIQFGDKFKSDIDRLFKEKPRLLRKTYELIFDIQNNPFDGLGKPEPLKGNLKGWWSRRINQEHRLIYKVHDDCIFLSSAFGHYEE